MEKRNIAIYFDDPAPMGYPFDHQNYFESYRQFAHLAAGEGVNIYFVRGDSHQGNLLFSSGWQFQGEGLVEVSEPIQAALVYIKGLGDIPHNLTAADAVINQPAFDDLCYDKLRTYEEVGEFMAPTYAVTQENWPTVLDKITTEMVVLKPIRGSGGEGVIIESKEAARRLPPFSEPYLVQEFIDASQGIPGVTEAGVQDLRIINFNGKHLLCYMRTPKEGSLLTNIAQGGLGQLIPLEKLPSAIFDIIRTIDAKFTHFGTRIYTLDFMFEGERPYIVELNPRPGFPHPALSGAETTALFHRYLLDTFKAELETTAN